MTARRKPLHLNTNNPAGYGSIEDGVHDQQQHEEDRSSHASSGWCKSGIDREELTRGILYGIINATICLPASISFSTIIFRHDAFAPYLPSLVRLVLLSSSVHALVFVCLSSMPFAVGQVQDAGLIFLSAMASAIVEYCHAHQYSDEVMLSTVLVMLALSTALLGVALIIIGRLRLASVVTYLPMAAVGGYLAFIGFFCGQAGLAFMTQLSIENITQWYKFLSPSALIKLSPGLVLGLSMFFLCRRIRHVLTLPVIMALSVAIFYIILLATDYTIDDARGFGWIADPLPPSPFYEAWSYFDLRIVRWEVIPLLIPTWLALTVVVAFSSSLDVAAIEMEIKRQLDYDHELKMIGVSNVVSGLTGGFTGSYIFSQTIFTLRSGAKSRICSAVIAMLELAAFMSPVSIIAYIPRFFFGGLLILIATDLLLEWLVMSRSKMMVPEYLVTLATFIAIQATNIELGMGIGILAAIVAFTFSYAEAPAVVHPKVRHSSVVRTFEERTILNANIDKMVTVSLRGYIFFGSAVKIMKEIKDHVLKGHTDKCAGPGPSHVPGPVPSTAAAAAAASAALYNTTSINDEPRSTSSLLSPIAASPPGPISRAKSSPRVVPSALTLDGRVTSVASGRGSRPPSSRSTRRRSASLAESDTGSRLGTSLGVGSARVSSSLMTPVYNRGGIILRPDDESEYARGGGDDKASASMRQLDSDDDDEEALLFHGKNRDEDEDDDALSPHDFISSPSSFETANGDVASGYASSRITSLSPERLYSPEPDPEIGPRSRSQSLSVAGAGGGRDDGVGGLAVGGPSTNGLIDWYLKDWASAELEADKASPDPGAYSVSSPLRKPHQSHSNRIRWLIFDFSAVTGLDATAARSCFLMLKSLLRSNGIKVVFAALSPRVATLLRAHGVVDDEDRVFETLDEALESCEEVLLRHACEMSDADICALSRHPSYYIQAQRSRRTSKWALLDPTGSRRDRPMAIDQALGLESILADYLEVAVSNEEEERERGRSEATGRRGPEEEGTEPASLSIISSHKAASIMADYFEEVEVYSGQCMFHAGEASSRLYFIRCGVVELQVANLTKDDVMKPVRLTKISDGGSFGELGFFLKRPQKFNAVAKTRCLLYSLSRESFLRMIKTQPQLASILQLAILKSICLAASYTISELNDLSFWPHQQSTTTST